MARSLILFGAGASFGSDDPSRTPPLGAALFDALREFSPIIWGAIDDTLASRFRGDFERGMLVFGDAHPDDGYVDQLQRAMAAYFFRYHPSPSSLYVRLAKRILACNWDGAIASLNYERLLRLALSDVGIARPPEICLPHGCCNLFGQFRADSDKSASTASLWLQLDGHVPVVTFREAPTGPISFAREARLDSRQLRVIDDPARHAQELAASKVPPVMSYFQPDKQTRAGVSFIDGQRRRFAELVRAASAVAIIGVKVRPGDRHIWDCLRDTSARIIYCAGRAAGDEFRSWSVARGRQDDEVMPCCWAKAFDDLCSRVGIA